MAEQLVSIIRKADKLQQQPEVFGKKAGFRLFLVLSAILFMPTLFALRFSIFSSQWFGLSLLAVLVGVIVSVVLAGVSTSVIQYQVQNRWKTYRRRKLDEYQRTLEYIVKNDYDSVANVLKTQQNSQILNRILDVIRKTETQQN